MPKEAAADPGALGGERQQEAQARLSAPGQAVIPEGLADTAMIMAAEAEAEEPAPAEMAELQITRQTVQVRQTEAVTGVRVIHHVLKPVLMEALMEVEEAVALLVRLVRK